MGGLWRNDEKTKGGKYLVVRRDGSIPPWPWFVLGARDPAAPFALLAYASCCEDLEMDPAYVSDVRALKSEFSRYAEENGHGDPTAPPESKDNPAIVAAIVTAGTGETRYRLIAETLWYLLEKIETQATDALLVALSPYDQLRLVQSLAKSRGELLTRSAGENATLIPVEVPR
jgi:hypothetical protein